MVTVTRIGDFALTWGESLRWDDRRQRLYCVDCATHTLHWLERAEPPLHSMPLPSMAAGIVLTDSGELVACLDDGLHVVDPDAGTTRLLAEYPEGMYGRANDANADGSGNLVTGTLNLVPAPGASWWFSAVDGLAVARRRHRQRERSGRHRRRRPVDAGAERHLRRKPCTRIPTTATRDHRERRVFGDHAALGGAPDGATADADNAVWSCVLGVGKIARFTVTGLDRVVDVPMPNPSDVTFGGPQLDRLFVTSIALNLGEAARTDRRGRLGARDRGPRRDRTARGPLPPRDGS